MRELITLIDYFLFYTYSSLHTDDSMYSDFWTEVAVLWNKHSNSELTNNAVRKRFKRRLKNLKEIKNSSEQTQDTDELYNYIETLANEFNLYRTEDIQDFSNDLIEVLEGESDLEFAIDRESDFPDPEETGEYTEKEFEEDAKLGDSIIQVHDLQYYYNDQTDTYVFFLSNKTSGKPLIIEGEDLKALKRRYSNWNGESSTINEVCRDFGIPRRWFHKLKTKLGWTHDSDPFLDKEIMEGDQEKMIEEVLQDKRRQLYQKFRMKEWDDIKKKAKKFDEIEATIVHPLQRRIEEYIGEYKPFNINMQGIQKDSDFSFVFAPTDIHMNKLPYDVNKFTVGGYEREVQRASDSLFKKVFNVGEPSSIINIVGSDLFHVDNIHHATSAGTPQAGQVFGNYYDVLMASYATMYNIADIAVSTGIPNEFFTIRGNHDAILSLSIGMALEQRYRHESNVSVDNAIDDRKYVKLGKYLIGMLHGEYLKTNQTTRNREIQGRILADAKKHKINVADVENYYMFSGHVHRSSATHHEDTGVFDIVCPSLSVTDWWHHLHNYEGNTKAIAGYLVSPYEGLINIVYESSRTYE